MNPSELIQLIEFFQDLRISEAEETTEEERANHQRVVRVTYHQKDVSFTTARLHYKDIEVDDEIYKPDEVISYFGQPVFWLDLSKHDWPRGSEKSDLDSLVIDGMIEGDNPAFKSFLLSLANNAQTGYIQRITREGRTAQYYHNFENNNHWHDIVKLIKAFIDSKGWVIDKKFFAPLVFNWHKHTDEALRTTLTDKAYPSNRKFISDLQTNLRNIQSFLMDSQLIKVLKSKKQILLQGPPGTGKTFRAKELAMHLLRENPLPAIDATVVKEHIYPGLSLHTEIDGAVFSIIGVDSSVKIRLASTGGTYSIALTRIVDSLNNKEFQKGANGNDDPMDPYTISIAKEVAEKIVRKDMDIIQFHPSYAYEDFVRGITVSINKDGHPQYIAENKPFGKIAAAAYENYRMSLQEPAQSSREQWIREQLQLFSEEVQQAVDTEERYKINELVAVVELDPDAFRYNGQNWQVSHRMRFNDLVALQLYETKTRGDVKNTPGVSGSAKQHATYYFGMLEKFRTFLSGRPPFLNGMQAVQLKNYVLIIDEFNRANLSSVLGELIYALEYRGEVVQAMYEVDGSRALIVPPNLFIIGTMNTADRSVGHVDYAIRRRFAFHDILPDETVIKEATSLRLFKAVKELFVKEENGIRSNGPDLSPDFRWKDVWPGHSYFLETDPVKLKIRLEYEIRPLLEEYVKDGVLMESASQKIAMLQC